MTVVKVSELINKVIQIRNEHREAKKNIFDKVNQLVESASQEIRNNEACELHGIDTSIENAFFEGKRMGLLEAKGIITDELIK